MERNKRQSFRRCGNSRNVEVPAGSIQVSRKRFTTHEHDHASPLSRLTKFNPFHFSAFIPHPYHPSPLTPFAFLVTSRAGVGDIFDWSFVKKPTKNSRPGFTILATLASRGYLLTFCCR